jgi:hypothetical protein
MKRTIVLAAIVAVSVTFPAGCAGAARSTVAGPATPTITTPTQTPPTSTPAGATPPAATATPCRPDDGPGEILRALTVERLADRDRVVFQFHGRGTIQAPRISYVDKVTEDPSDLPVALLGEAFLTVVFHGARLDTAPTESDPDKVVRYDGPTRLTPRWPLLRELAITGDFEAVLSFGLGLSHRAGIHTTAPPGAACLILDLS